jgi:hypothetical protein
MSQEAIWQQAEAITGQSKTSKPNRKFEIQAKDFTSSEQAVPIRLIYGRARVAGIYITPIFGFRATQTTTNAGK